MKRRPTAAIIGVGLMGGSLGAALVRGRAWRVVGWGRSAAKIRKAVRRRCLHHGTTDAARAVSGADVVVLALPVDRIIPWARRLRPHLKPGALLMDVGSVKGPIVKTLGRFFSSAGGPRFVGAHPMAGSEKTGAENARPDLYRGATCVLTPALRTPRAVRGKAEKFWRAVGARVITLTPEDHDRWIALISHLPHLAAEALVLTAVRRSGNAKQRRLLKKIAAGSFRDMTRVAGADPILWNGIFTMNAAAVRAAAADFQKALSDILRSRWSSALLGSVQKAQKELT